MNKIDKEDILLFRDTVNTQAPIDKDGVSRIHKLERKPPFTQYSYVIDGTMNDTHKLLKLFAIDKFRQRLTSLFYRIPMQIQFRYIVKMTTLHFVHHFLGYAIIKPSIEGFFFMNKIDKEDILLFRDTVNTQAPIDKDGVRVFTVSLNNKMSSCW
jgi:hypothetical protein